MALHKKIIGHSMNHSLSSQARTFFDMDQLNYQTGVPCRGDVFVTSAFLSYGTEADCYRPFFVLTGRLSKIRGPFADGVTEVSFLDTDRPEVRMEYELTNSQIAALYTQNVFPELEDAKLFLQNKESRYITRSETVSTPDIMYNNTYEDLPISCAVLMVKNAEQPILFVQPEKQFNIPLTAESSGYSLETYMDPFQQEKVAMDEVGYTESLDLRKSLEKSENTAEKTVSSEAVAEIGSPVVQELFAVTKPRVDEHVEADDEYIRQVNEVLLEGGESSTYASPFEQMMLEDTNVSATDDLTKSEDAVMPKMPPVSGGPLTMEQVLARKKHQLAKQQEKAMPKNLEEIQQNAEKSSNDQNAF